MSNIAKGGTLPTKKPNRFRTKAESRKRGRSITHSNAVYRNGKLVKRK
jgi:hypothetical protein